MLNQQYEIPKEIKTKPKLLGLDIKEMAVLIILVILIMTFFKDMVHGWFVFPYLIVSIGFLFYMIAPSSSNPQKKNYHSIILFFKRDKNTYHPLDIYKDENIALMKRVQEANQIKALELNKKETVFLDETTVDMTKTSDNQIESNDERIGSNYQEIVEKINEGSVSKQIEVAALPTEKEFNQNDSNAVPESVVLLHHANEKKHDEEIHRLTEVPLENAFVPSSSSVSSNETKSKRKKSFRYFGVASVVLAVLIIGAVTGYYLQQQNLISANDTQEEVLVNAIRSASLKDYETAAVHFDSIAYETLSDEDKDVMLLSYLFSDQPEKALELEPSFDEAIASYYVTNRSMEKLRTLAETTDIKVFAFEAAVVDKDYNLLIELKDFVKMKESRIEIVVNAYVELGKLKEAKVFAEEQQALELVEKVNQLEEELKAKEEEKDKENEEVVPENKEEINENETESDLT